MSLVKSLLSANNLFSLTASPFFYIMFFHTSVESSWGLSTRALRSRVAGGIEPGEPGLTGVSCRRDSCRPRLSPPPDVVSDVDTDSCRCCCASAFTAFVFSCKTTKGTKFYYVSLWNILRTRIPVQKCFSEN
jgi:hypothetical protein